MGKKTVKDIEIHEAHRRGQAWKKKLSPPFLCPVCHQERAVFTKKKKIEEEIFIGKKKRIVYKYQFFLFCRFGCFKMAFIYDTPVKEAVDAYCELVDRIKQTPMESVGEKFEF